MNPFDFINAINTSKKDVMVDDIAEKEYNAYIVNRSLSYFQDTVLIANEMNIHHQIDNRLQFDFYINIVNKRKRFSKWLKPNEVDNLEVVKQYYGYSDEKAKSVLPLLNSVQIEELNKRIYQGGRK